MDNKVEVKKKIGESPLAISDWITFLSSEKNTIFGGMSNFIAVLVALISVLLAMTQDNWQYVGNGIFALMLVIFVFSHTFKPLQKRGKRAEELLDRIMAGELTSEETIRKEWMDGIK